MLLVREFRDVGQVPEVERPFPVLSSVLDDLVEVVGSQKVWKDMGMKSENLH